MTSPGNSINEITTGITGFTGTAFVGTPVTQYNILTGAATSSALNNVAPSATSGVPVISQGAVAQPIFGTAVVAGGGTGQVTLTNHGVLIGAATAAISQTAAGTAGQVLQSGGALADPLYSTATYPLTAGTTGNVITSDGTNFLSSPVAAATYDPPIGSLQYFDNAAGTAYLGANWLQCNGAIVSQATYATLYVRLGLVSDAGLSTFTTFSGNPATTNSCIFANNLFVAVGASGLISTSTDSITWTARTSGTASALNCITFGNGLYLTGGIGPVAINSTDAITWSIVTTGTASDIWSVVFGNGLYLIGTNAGAIRSSTDTITWTARTSNSGGGRILSLSAGASKYIWTTSSSTTAIGYSTDAITWTALTQNQFAGFDNSIFFNSLFLAFSTKTSTSPGVVYSSTDAITWAVTLWAYALTTAGRALAASATTLYFLGKNRGDFNVIGTSTNGTSFNTYDISTLATTNGNIAVGNNKLSLPRTTNYYTNLYSYNTATSFRLPTEARTGTLNVEQVPYNLYIKAL